METLRSEKEEKIPKPKTQKKIEWRPIVLDIGYHLVIGVLSGMSMAVGANVVDAIGKQRNKSAKVFPIRSASN